MAKRAFQQRNTRKSYCPFKQPQSVRGCLLHQPIIWNWRYARHHGHWYQSCESIYFWTQHPRTKQLHQKKFPNKQAKVVIGYDCRHQSDTLAKTVADIFSANDIHVYSFCASANPEVSFAVRELGLNVVLFLLPPITHLNIMATRSIGKMVDRLYHHTTMRLLKKSMQLNFLTFNLLPNQRILHL